MRGPTEPGAPAGPAHLAARVGRLLLAAGADTEHVAARIDEVARLLGGRADRLVGTEAILVGVDGADGTVIRIGHPVASLGADMGRLVAIEECLDRLRAGDGDAAALGRSLDALEAHRAGLPGPLVMVGVAVTAASLARLFGGGWPVVAAAFAAVLVGTALRLALAQRGANPIATAFLVALVSGFVAEAAVRLSPGASPVICLTAAGMVLVPGVPLLNGVRDLVAGHGGNAVARLVIGATTVLVIGFALLLVVAGAGDTFPIGVPPGTLPLGQDLLFAATAAAGYSTLFNLPPRAVPACIACGAASHGLRTLLESIGVGVAAGSLVGALAAGLVARAAAARFRAPPVVFAFPGIVAMVPGSYGFRAAIGGWQVMTLGAATPFPLIAETLSLTIVTMVVTAAIGVGLVVALSLPFPSRPVHPIQD